MEAESLHQEVEIHSLTEERPHAQEAFTATAVNPQGLPPQLPQALIRKQPWCEVAIPHARAGLTLLKEDVTKSRPRTGHIWQPKRTKSTESTPGGAARCPSDTSIAYANIQPANPGQAMIP